MENHWREDEAREFVRCYGQRWGEDLALRTYTSRLLGAEPALVLHGGGNTSVKGSRRNALGDEVPALFVKASGHDLADIEPDGHVAVQLQHLRRIVAGDPLDDAAMLNEMRLHLFDHRDPSPSIEAPVHAVVPGKFVDHTHADAILALSNRPNGAEVVRRALGEDVLLLDYVPAGFRLSQEVADALEGSADAGAMVWMRHGLLTWGQSARESYERMIALVTRAEEFLAAEGSQVGEGAGATSSRGAEHAAPSARLAPLLRGVLARPSGDPDRPHRRVILRSLRDPETLAFLALPDARERVMTPPLTADHLIRTKALPLWVDADPQASADDLRATLRTACDGYGDEYRAYFERHRADLEADLAPFDPDPRVVLWPGVGAFAAGATTADAQIALDITRQTLRVKAGMAASGVAYEGLSEDHLFQMEYRPLQHAKLAATEVLPLARHVALVTGAAGAIGAGVCRGLLEDGAQVAVTDLAGQPLEGLVAELSAAHPGRVVGVPLNVTDSESVAAALDAVVAEWGGLDLLVINAGVAHVSTLQEMDAASFERVESVNVHGTLLPLQQAARLFREQGTGGDVVLISTKNVFAPGAGFGAYSATKAAAHQLARIASLELAEIDVRVNMVAPDAVFSDGARKSGLWAEVGPDRMKARGLDEAGLEEYYRKRNLLKAKVTAEHVANAVHYFATRQTPTTGATLPVDGGLPDATPR